MKILLDNCVDRRFAALLFGHECIHARDLGWAELQNGHLLTSAEDSGFALIVTVDKNMRFQQNMAKRRLALITLIPLLVDFSYLEPLAAELLAVLDRGLLPGQSVTIGG